MNHLPKGLNIKIERSELGELSNYLFNSVDLDKNGEISFEEFKKWCFSQYELEEQNLMGKTLKF